MAEIRWYGHNCFRIKAREATILTDPVGKNTGYTLGRQSADIVTMSHEHRGHANTASVKSDYTLIDAPGEYELHRVSLIGLRTLHGPDRSSDLGYNTVFVFELEGIRFAHLGDLGHALGDDEQEALEGVDIVFAPVGGGPLLSPSDMAEVVGTISPKLVIPMQFRTPEGDSKRDTAESFAKQLGLELPAAVEKLVVKPSDLGEQMQIAVLKPEA